MRRIIKALKKQLKKRKRLSAYQAGVREILKSLPVQSLIIYTKFLKKKVGDDKKRQLRRVLIILPSAKVNSKGFERKIEFAISTLSDPEWEKHINLDEFKKLFSSVKQ
ncbi:MAG: hypothetical protein WC499_00070 [Patescibacteria group bacterium]